MAEYYSKEQLLECAKTALQYDMYDLEDFLEEVPTADVVEVVRCRECIHKFDIEGRCMCNINAEEAFGKWFGLRATHDDFYCAYGERRTDNDLL